MRVLPLSLSGLAMLAAGALNTHHLLIWNASSSVPQGLYWIIATDRPNRGELVVVWPARDLRAMMASRGYLPANRPLIKPAFGIPGDVVCRRGEVVSVNDRDVARARSEDAAGRELPVWFGCRRIKGDELFLLSLDRSDSFDGRYFGPSAFTVIGRAIPVWITD